jgi:hypothetical protein
MLPGFVSEPGTNHGTKNGSSTRETLEKTLKYCTEFQSEKLKEQARNKLGHLLMCNLWKTDQLWFCNPR